MSRDYAHEYSVAKQNKTKSYMHKFTRAGKDGRNASNKARRKLRIKKGDSREVDHKTPVSRGGGNSRKNLRIISRKTNRRKGTKDA